MKILMIILGLLVGTGGVERSELQAYSYGPACQWIRLVGEVKGAKESERVGLTVTYQLPEMKNPATLLTNYPVGNGPFKFVLAGFGEEIEGVHFVSPMFFFAKEIVFRYFIKNRDGSRRSPFAEKAFRPPLIPMVTIPKYKNRDFKCHSAISLGSLELGKRKFR